MDLMLYGEDNKGLIKVDPRTKVFIFFASGLMSLSSYSNTGTTLYVIALCAVFALCGKPKTAVKAALLFAVVLYLRFVLNNSKGAPGIFVHVITALTTVFMFGVPTVMSVMLLVMTTRISHFISAFQAMHVPVRVIVPFAVFFRFLPTVSDEWNGIRKAMAFRGISLSPASIICHPWKTIEYILIPMLFSSMSIMEELAAASMARGLDADSRRSSYDEVKMKAVDLILIILFSVLLAFSIILGFIVRGGTVT